MKRPYFAYGSNLWLPRLRQRVPGVRPVAPARAMGYELRWHKRGRDGSGKCSVTLGEPGSVVHGALFHVPRRERHLLDTVEGLGCGYEEVTLEVELGGRCTEAWTYRAEPEWVEDALRPFVWYRALVLAGAEALGFPEPYVERLRRVEALEDPDGERAARNLRLLRSG